jgi:hypothetical protein
MSRLFLSNIDLNKNEIQNPRAQNLASVPSSPVTGQFFYDTTNVALYVYNGTAWVPTDASKVSAGFIPFTKLGTPSAAFAMGGNKITGLGTPTASGDAAEFAWVNSRPLNTFATPSADIPMGGRTFTGLNTNPTLAGQAAEYSWVVGQIQSATAGITSRPPVRLVATTNLTLTGAATIDGVAVATNDRILATGQTTPAQNGVYLANTGGAWTRAVSEDQANEMSAGSLWFVTEGATNTATQWRQATTGAITLGTTALSIVQFGAATPYTANNGVLLSANNFSAVADPAAGAGILVTSAGIKVDPAEVTRKFSQTLSTSATSYVITHNLGTQDVVVAVRAANSPFDIVECDVQATSTTQVTLLFATAPTANAYRVTVMG